MARMKIDFEKDIKILKHRLDVLEDKKEGLTSKVHVNVNSEVTDPGFVMPILEPLPPSPPPLPLEVETPMAEIKSEPNFFEIILEKIKHYFTTGNTIVKVGVVLIFFGISFLLKYAIDNDLFPIEYRLIACAFFALVILKIGWNLRLKSREYGLVLQGGGIGVLILTTFVSLKSYALISPEIAFSLLISFVTATAILSIKQDSLNLALFGLVGGFFAPILVSTGSGNHIILFSYYALLNMAIVYISWKKSWRTLNLMGFIFTFAISSIWGVLKYRPEFYWSTQPFLILFFLIYLIIPILFANKKRPELKGYLDGTIVFGNSIFSLLLQLQLIEGIPYAGSFSSLGFASVYIFVSRYLLKHKNENYRLLAEAYISISVIFITVAIPLAFDGFKTAAIWSLEASGLYWFGIRQNRPFARGFSVFLIFASSVAFFFARSRGSLDLLFLNTYFMSCILIASGFYVMSYLSQIHQDKISSSEKELSNFTFLFGTLWWVFGGVSEISYYLKYFQGSNRGFLSNAQLLYLTICSLILFTIARKIVWNKLRLLTHGLVFTMFLYFLLGLSYLNHPFEEYGYVSWALSIASYYYILFYNDQKHSEQKNILIDIGHAGILWVVVGLLVVESHWIGNTFIQESSAWKYAAHGVIPIFVIWFITEKKDILKWPILKNHSVYMSLGLIPIVASSWLWLMITNWLNTGSAEPLIYIPILNPLDLSHLGVMFVITLWFMRSLKTSAHKQFLNLKDVGVFLGVTYFIWLNGLLCRAIHQYVGIPYDFSSLFSSVIVQVSLSIYWTILGIVLMVFAAKKVLRWLWLIGAGLLGIVVVKMFLIDLSSTERMAQVISFIGVGILFLIVGYFSPIPPKTITEEKS